jgi:hypothetical protein
MAEFIGQMIGPYRIIEQIGLGGMATTFSSPTTARFGWPPRPAWDVTCRLKTNRLSAIIFPIGGNL